MTRIAHGLVVPVALFALLCGVPRVTEASLINDSVTCVGITMVCAPATAIVGAGPEFTLDLSGVMWSVDVAASSITVQTLEQPGVVAGGANAIFGDLDSSTGDIVGVSLVTSGGISGINASNLSFTAHCVNLTTTFSVWPAGSTAVIS